MEHSRVPVYWMLEAEVVTSALVPLPTLSSLGHRHIGLNCRAVVPRDPSDRLACRVWLQQGCSCRSFFTAGLATREPPPGRMRTDIHHPSTCHRSKQLNLGCVCVCFIIRLMRSCVTSCRFPSEWHLPTPNLAARMITQQERCGPSLAWETWRPRLTRAGPRV